MNILDKISAKYEEIKQKNDDIVEFKEYLLKAVDDVVLTEEEIIELEKKRDELNLTNDDVQKIKTKIYLAAYKTAKSDSFITKDEEQELEKIQNYLRINDSEIKKTKKELYRLRLLSQIQEGNIPVIMVNNIILQKGEKVYWVEPGELLEEKVINRKYKGGSKGVSFRVMKGVHYRIGGTKGHVIIEKGIVNVSDGKFVITNKRLIFRGVIKSFATKFEKIINFDLYEDGINIFEINKAKSRIVKFKDKSNIDIIGAILTSAINNLN